MREQILTRLGGTREPVSEDLLAQQLGLSRTGVWKHIQALRKQGIEIAAIPGRGYRLESEVLTPALLQARLQQGKQLRVGREIIILDETDSTNRQLMRMAESGAADGTVMLAHRQSAGRGRLGRRWHTLNDALACSVLLRPALPPERIPQLSLLTAVALHEGLSAFAPDIAIKWPNDLQHKGAKLAGILTEMRAEPGRVHAVVLGFGINLKPPAEGWPEDIGKPATDLQSIGGPVFRLDVISSVLASLDEWYERYLKEGFAPVHRAWWQAHAACGRPVRVHDGRDYIEGIAVALDEDGALLLRTERGEQRIIAGDLELL